MPDLSPTRKLAERIAAELAPFCERLEIAGSIRRGRAWVNDIDLVALPKAGQRVALMERCQKNATLVKCGPKMGIFRLGNDVQLDLWIAHGDEGDFFSKTPCNFGSLLLCRTGSKEHNIFLVEHAKARGLAWNPHEGVFRGETVIAGATEEDIFRALDLPWIKPEERER